MSNKIRKNYELMIKCFVRNTDYVPDKHTQSEQNAVTASGVYNTQFFLWNEIVLTSTISLRINDIGGLMVAAKNLKSQLYKMYKKKNIKQAVFLFDADFDFDLDKLNQLL